MHFIRRRIETGRADPVALTIALAILLMWNATAAAFGAGGREESAGADTAEEKPLVFVSILPQAYFAERIGGGRVDVRVLVQPGQSPHSYDPTPRQMEQLARADLFLRIGVEFENALMPKIERAMQGLEVVDCRGGIELRHMEEHGHDDAHGHEEHGHEAHHHDGGRDGADPHIWLSARNAVRISATMRDELTRLDPEGREAYEDNYAGLEADLKALDRRISEILAPVRGKTFFVFHPAFGYFARDYGLRQVAVETGGKQPGTRQLEHLIEEAKEQGVRVIFVQPQFARKSAEAIAEAIDGAVVPIDPLARDYLENLERMAERVEEGLR